MTKLHITLSPKIVHYLKPVWRYRAVLFFVFVAAACGYLVLQINSALSVPAASDTTTTAVHKSPRVDPAVIQKLQQLQDNSVSVQTLFNQARDNPFQ